MKNIKHFIDLLLGVTEKELRARYKYTIFGFFWLVANPLLQMMVIGFIFTFLMKEPIRHYYYYLFIGLLTWNFFSLSLTKSTPSIVFERGLIKKAKFPREIIPLSIILSNLVHFLIALLLYFVPILFLETLKPHSIPLIIAAIVLLTAFTAGLSLLTSALNAKYRDINFFVQALLVIWFYVTPIAYTLDFIPPKFYWIWRLNPLTCVVQLFQYGFLDAAAPGPLMVAANGCIIFAVLCVGIIVFRKESKNFDDWI